MLASTELATEYLTLGRLQRAGRVFNAALDRFRAAKGSESTRVFFLLRHSQTLAVLGDLDQRSVDFSYTTCRAHIDIMALANLRMLMRTS